jgi:hypothetical protein
MADDQSNGSPRDDRRMSMGGAIALGAGVGTAMFVATGGFIWILVGVVVGAAFGAALRAWN